jgi:hypothetical protein
MLIGTEVSHRGESLVVLGIVRRGSEPFVVVGSPNPNDNTPEVTLSLEAAEKGAAIAALEPETVSFARIWDQGA